MNKSIAMISVHECPLASSEGKERGGINVYTFELSKALSELGWHVDAFTRIQDTYNPRVVQVNDRFRVIHVPSGTPTPLSKREIIKTIPEFTEYMNHFIASENADYTAVHAHYYLSGMVAENLEIVRENKTPLIMTFHTMGLLKQLVSHSMESEDPSERVPAERMLTRVSDRIITSSEAGKDYLTGLYECDEEKIAIIPPGVDTSLFTSTDQQEARTRIGVSKSHKLVLAVGRIDPVKGFDVLLAAVKILSQKDPKLAENLCVMIVGGDVGQSKDMWSREMKKLDSLRKLYNLTTSVQFVPTQAQSALPMYYSAADVLVMPSHYESFGMVTLEALSCGTPVIATDVTGISPIVREVPQGHIISANNPIALAEEMMHVLTSHEGHHMRAPEINDFDWKKIAERMALEYGKTQS